MEIFVVCVIVGVNSIGTGKFDELLQTRLVIHKKRMKIDVLFS